MAFLVCLAIACVWPGLAAFHDLRGGYYDAVALCLLLLSMAAESPALVGICAFLAAWTDERALIALPLVLLFRATNARARVAAIAIAGAGYAVTRVALAFLYGWTTNTAGAGFGVFRHQASMLPVGIWTGLGGCWILVIASMYVLLRKKQFFTLALFALALALVLAAAMRGFRRHAQRGLLPSGGVRCLGDPPAPQSATPGVSPGFHRRSAVSSASNAVSGGQERVPTPPRVRIECVACDKLTICV